MSGTHKTVFDARILEAEIARIIKERDEARHDLDVARTEIKLLKAIARSNKSERDAAWSEIERLKNR